MTEGQVMNVHDAVNEQNAQNFERLEQQLTLSQWGRADERRLRLVAERELEETTALIDAALARPDRQEEGE
jgi:hypothetical protein